MFEIGALQSDMDSGTGETALDLKDTLFLRMQDDEEFSFQVVALLEDEENACTYAVLLHQPSEGEERFIVTDSYGNLLEDETLAQQVLDDYLVFAQEASEEEER